jgi:hypothetical protein
MIEDGVNLELSEQTVRMAEEGHAVRGGAVDRLLTVRISPDDVGALSVQRRIAKRHF